MRFRRMFGRHVEAEAGEEGDRLVIGWNSPGDVEGRLADRVVLAVAAEGVVGVAEAGASEP